MRRFYTLIFSYLVLLILSYVFVNSYFLESLVFLSTVILLLITWGVANIRSQMFVKTFSCNSNAKGKVALTYDDGPHSKNTPELLGILENAKASFFLIGQNVGKYPELSHQIHQKGHLIGNHSYYHKNIFPFTFPKKMKEEIIKTQIEIKKITGGQNVYFRPPFGVTNPNIAKAVEILQLETIGWSIRTYDTMITNPGKIIQNIIILNFAIYYF